jgi:hypothetical protein
MSDVLGLKGFGEAKRKVMRQFEDVEGSLEAILTMMWGFDGFFVALKAL